MSRIQLLPETLANQIAAGEVVQRPASVVKELLENAIDAGARHIKLIVKDGGKGLIQVIDDGHGMDETDARMCFERHATSKIRNTDDLFRIQTKGFRGEALASIAAVAHVELRTRTEDMELGTLVRIEGGRLVSQEPVSAPKGTSIAVKNLFFNVPARRKFLKSAQVEMRHIIDEFQRVAIPHHHIGFTLIHNGHEVYRLLPSNLMQRIAHIFGRKMPERLVPVSEQTDYIKIHGYAGKPEFAKQRRGEQFFFVNNRYFKSSYLHSAVMQAYEGLLPEKRIPPYFLFFEIDPGHIDVNIHPTKTEIKFDDEYTVYNLLRASVRHALGKFDQMPSIDFDITPGLIPRAKPSSGKTYREPKIQVDPRFNPFRDDRPQHPFPGQISAPQTPEEPPVLPDFSTVEETVPEPPQGTTVFQWKDKYLVTRMPEGLMIVHQHRAHKSVLFARFLDQLSRSAVNTQELLFPESRDYMPAELDLLEKHKDILHQTGIRFRIEGQTLHLSAVPAGVEPGAVLAFMDELLAHWSDDIPLQGDELHRFLANKLAAKAAIRTGHKMSTGEQQQLLAQLFRLPEPKYDPSGKPNFIILPQEDIDKKFE